MTSTKIEFLVKMTCNACIEKINAKFNKVSGVKQLDINIENGTVIIESTLPTLELQKNLESTGLPVAIKGYDGSIAGVSIIEAGDSKVRGVIRFIQATPDTCVIDGTIDGLQPGNHSIAIYECGDISQGCASLGKVYNPKGSTSERIYGNIGEVTVEKNGRAEFRFEDKVINLSDIIGRSFAVSKQGNADTPIACGIVARSAGLFQNPKTICACDGKTIWDEVSNPNSKSSL